MVRLRVGLKQQIGIKATMKRCFQLLHNSPARRADFVSVTGSKLFPLFFCATRWVEDRDVADRLLKIWVHIKSIMKFWLKLPKSKQPKCKSFTNVNTAVDDELHPVKLSLLHSILQVVVNQEVIDDCASGQDLLKIDLSKDENFKKRERLPSWIFCRTHVRVAKEGLCQKE